MNFIWISTKLSGIEADSTRAGNDRVVRQAAFLDAGADGSLRHWSAARRQSPGCKWKRGPSLSVRVVVAVSARDSLAVSDAAPARQMTKRPLSVQRAGVSELYAGGDPWPAVSLASVGYQPRGSWLASRASSSMAFQSPASTNLAGATQLPPAQTTFDRLR